MKLIKYSALSFVIAMLFIFGCGKKVETNRSPGAGKAAVKNEDEKSSSELVNQRVLAFNLEGLTDKGEKKWDVSGESAESVTENKIKLNNVTAKSYGNGSEATIRGDVGIYDKANNNVTLNKNVKATIQNAEQFSGELMSMPDKLQGANGAGNVKKTPGSKPGKNPTIITCDGDVQFDYVKNMAYFDKNVKVVSDDGYIDADRITVNLDAATKKTKEIIAEGNVKIARGENVSYSDKATYVEAEKKVILTGQPKLVIYQEGEVKDNLMGSLVGNISGAEKK